MLLTPRKDASTLNDREQSYLDHEHWLANAMERARPMNDTPLAEPLHDHDTTIAPLDQRIADALSDDSALTSAELESLFAEIDRVHELTLDAADEARRQSLAPGNTNPDADRAQAASLEFIAERLREAAPQVATRADTVAASEQAAAWEQQYLQAEAQQNAIAAEFATIYPELVSTVGVAVRKNGGL